MNTEKLQGYYLRDYALAQLEILSNSKNKRGLILGRAKVTDITGENIIVSYGSGYTSQGRIYRHPDLPDFSVGQGVCVVCARVLSDGAIMLVPTEETVRAANVVGDIVQLDDKGVLIVFPSLGKVGYFPFGVQRNFRLCVGGKVYCRVAHLSATEVYVYSIA